MALKPCGECGHRVSTKAESCPNCGAPVSSTRSTQQPFETHPTKSSQVSDGPVWRGRPKIRSYYWYFFRAVIFFIFLGAFAIWAQSQPASSPILLNIDVILGVFMAFGAILLVRPFIWSWQTRYLVNPSSIIVTKGILARDKSQMLLLTIKDLKLHQSILQRLLNIGDIEFISTDADLGKLHIRGIGSPNKTFDLINAAWQNRVHTRGVVMM